MKERKSHKFKTCFLPLDLSFENSTKTGVLLNYNLILSLSLWLSHLLSPLATHSHTHTHILSNLHAAILLVSLPQTHTSCALVLMLSWIHTLFPIHTQTNTHTLFPSLSHSLASFLLHSPSLLASQCSRPYFNVDMLMVISPFFRSLTHSLTHEYFQKLLR